MSCIKVYSLNPWLHGHEVEYKILEFDHFSRLAFWKSTIADKAEFAGAFITAKISSALKTKERENQSAKPEKERERPEKEMQQTPSE